ncbi:hypothetical protein C8R46DRAFT_1233848 [Mycena filopes]|nr:hypothetical protein C8R46DRAFT_1233848 [Mycena filopes]
MQIISALGYDSAVGVEDIHPACLGTSSPSSARYDSLPMTDSSPTIMRGSSLGRKEPYHTNTGLIPAALESPRLSRLRPVAPNDLELLVTPTHRRPLAAAKRPFRLLLVSLPRRTRTAHCRTWNAGRSVPVYTTASSPRGGICPPYDHLLAYVPVLSVAPSGASLRDWMTSLLPSRVPSGLAVQTAGPTAAAHIAFFEVLLQSLKPRRARTRSASLV